MRAITPNTPFTITHNTKLTVKDDLDIINSGTYKGPANTNNSVNSDLSDFIIKVRMKRKNNNTKNFIL